MTVCQLYCQSTVPLWRQLSAVFIFYGPQFRVSQPHSEGNQTSSDTDNHQKVQSGRKCSHFDSQTVWKSSEKIKKDSQYNSEKVQCVQQSHSNTGASVKEENNMAEVHGYLVCNLSPLS